MRNIPLALAALLAVLLCSCGYQIGNTAHPQIRTVYIGQISNFIDEPRMGGFMLEKLKERFRQDGSFDLVSSPELADVIIEGKVAYMDYQQRGHVSIDNKDGINQKLDKDYRPDTYRSTVTFKYEMKTRHDWTVAKGAENAYAEFVETLDQTVDRREALRRCAYSLARKVVADLAEGW